MTTERFADSEQMPPELVSLLENLPDDQLKEVLERWFSKNSKNQQKRNNQPKEPGGDLMIT